MTFLQRLAGVRRLTGWLRRWRSDRLVLAGNRRGPTLGIGSSLVSQLVLGSRRRYGDRVPVILFPDSLHLPLDDDLAQVDSELLLLDGGRGCEAQPLNGADHVLDEVVPHRVVDFVVLDHQLEDVDKLKQKEVIAVAKMDAFDFAKALKNYLEQHRPEFALSCISGELLKESHIRTLLGPTDTSTPVII